MEDIVKRRRVLDTPYPAFDENGEQVMIRSDVFVFPPGDDGWVKVEWEGRVNYVVRVEVLEAHTHLP
jgi:hypothetical protein